MPVVNTNISARLSINAMRANEIAQNKAMGHLATAKRINSVSDDAVGLKITQNALMNVGELQRLSRNIMDAISMIETIDGYAASIAASLQRMRELAVQSATGTYTDSDRQALDQEFGQLWSEIQNSARGDKWNGKYAMAGFNPTGLAAEGSSNRTNALWLLNIDKRVNTIKDSHRLLTVKNFDPQSTFEQTAQMQTDARAFNAGTGQNKNFAINVFNPDLILNTQGTSVYGSAVLYVGNGAAEGDATNTRIDIAKQANASFSMTQIDAAIEGLSQERSKYGAYISMLENHFSNITNRAINQDTTRSKIEDTSYSEETAELSKTQIVAQASTAMLAQANQSKQTILALLQ
jgi:flagellin